MEQSNEGLRREIGIPGLSANIVNIIVGAGIFVLPAIVAARLGASAILAYLVCGLLITLVMLCFAEAGSRITTSGGPYTYIEEAFGKYAGFLALFLFLTSTLSADAAVANALADILASVVPVFALPVVRVVFFILVFSGLVYINVIGVRQGIGLVKFNTIAKLTPLLLLVFVGWTQISGENLAWESMPALRTIGEASLILFFAFQGAESGLTIGGEVRDPARTVPRSILIAVSVVLILYVLIQITAQGVLGAALVDFREGPLTEVAAQVFGPFGILLMTAGAAVSMFGTVSGTVLSVPRMIFRAAKDGVLPVNVLARVHPRFSTPHVAIIVYASLGFLLASLGGFTQLAVLSSASMLLIYLGVAVSVIRFRKLTSERDHTAFRLPGGWTIPIVAAGIVVWLLSGLSRQEQIGAVVFVAGLSLIYVIVRYLKRDEKFRV